LRVYSSAYKFIASGPGVSNPYDAVQEELEKCGGVI
jgi:hypothetical protein